MTHDVMKTDRRERSRGNLRLVWNSERDTQPDSLMLCVGMTEQDSLDAGEAAMMWVHTAQGRLLLAVEGVQVHRALEVFAPLAEADPMQVDAFVRGFDALTAKLFDQVERPDAKRSTTPVRVNMGEIVRLLEAVGTAKPSSAPRSGMQKTAV